MRRQRKKKYCGIVGIVINQLQALFPPNKFISIEMGLYQWVGKGRKEKFPIICTINCSIRAGMAWYGGQWYLSFILFIGKERKWIVKLSFGELLSGVGEWVTERTENDTLCRWNGPPLQRSRSQPRAAFCKCIRVRDSHFRNFRWFIHSFTKKGTRDQCLSLPVPRSSGSEGGVTNHSALRVLHSNICRFLSLKYHHNHMHTVNWGEYTLLTLKGRCVEGITMHPTTTRTDRVLTSPPLGSKLSFLRLRVLTFYLFF